MTGFLLYLGGVLIWVPVIRHLIFPGHPDPPVGDAMVLAGIAVMTVANALVPDWPWAITFAVTGVVAVLLWWRRRKKRRTLAALGAKARARIAAMAGTMRERAKPKQALRPQRSPA